MTTPTLPSTQVLINCSIFDGESIQSGINLIIEHGKIRSLSTSSAIPPDARIINCADELIAPGFIDTQVNGGDGMLFNNEATAQGISRILHYHRRYGTTGFLPTLISPSRALIHKALSAVELASKFNDHGCLGIHVEGPFLNKHKRGVHPEEQILTFDDQDVLLFSGYDYPILLTVAPEALTVEQIQQLSDKNIIVSLGHSTADFETTKNAVQNGATGFTHLFNAMSPLTSREPGMVGAALAEDQAWCGIILDGHHVHPASAKIAIQAKPKGKVFLVTDAVHAAGSQQERLNLLGQTIINKAGKVCTPEGTLAGSCLTMIEAVKNAQSMLGLSLEESLRMGSLYPAQFLGLDHQLGRIKPNYNASLIALDKAQNVTKSWINGCLEDYSH